MSKKDVKIAVEAFIDKYSTPPVQRVKWPQWDFKIKGVSKVTIKEESLKDFEKLLTFEGTADIHKTDGVTDVITKGMYRLVGNATVVYKPNGGNQNELLPEVEDVTITKLEKI